MVLGVVFPGADHSFSGNLGNQVPVMQSAPLPHCALGWSSLLWLAKTHGAQTSVPYIAVQSLTQSHVMPGIYELPSQPTPLRRRSYRPRPTMIDDHNTSTELATALAITPHIQALEHVGYSVLFPSRFVLTVQMFVPPWSFIGPETVLGTEIALPSMK